MFLTSELGYYEAACPNVRPDYSDILLPSITDCRLIKQTSAFRSRIDRDQRSRLVCLSPVTEISTESNIVRGAGERLPGFDPRDASRTLLRQRHHRRSKGGDRAYSQVTALGCQTLSLCLMRKTEISVRDCADVPCAPLRCPLGSLRNPRSSLLPPSRVRLAIAFNEEDLNEINGSER